jgi:hypothetical protein
MEIALGSVNHMIVEKPGLWRPHQDTIKTQQTPPKNGMLPSYADATMREARLSAR